MPSIGVLVLLRIRGRRPRLVVSPMLCLLGSMVASLVVSELVGHSLHREHTRRQARALLLLVGLFSSPMEEVVLVLLLPLRHHFGVRSVDRPATPLGSARTVR